MARVCPACRRMVGDAESTCSRCGAPTLDVQAWRQVRGDQLGIAPAEQPTPADEHTLSEDRLKLGLGGMLAALTFFVVYLIAYVTYYYS